MFVYILLLLLITMGFAAILVRYVNKRTLLDSINHKSNLHLSGWFYKGSILFQLFISIGFVFCTLVMMKNSIFCKIPKNWDWRNISGSHSFYLWIWNTPFKEILKQMPDVTECLCGFSSPIPKSSFSSYELREWEGQTDKEQRTN